MPEAMPEDYPATAGFAGMAAGFAGALRARGVAVPVSSLVAFVEALGAVGLERRAGVYWAGRATLVQRPEDAPAFDAAFAAFWVGREEVTATVPVPPRVEIALPVDDADDPGPDGPDGDGRVLVVAAGDRETLRSKDFASCTPVELDELRALMAGLRIGGAMRRSRRRAPARRAGALDLRATVRRSLRTGGEPVRREWRRPRTQPRRVVLLCDVSGSMEPYARGLLRFAHAAVVGRRRVEAFALGTRLTRLTRQLGQRDADAALTRATEAAADWGGGTRLGAGLRAFNDEWGVRGMARGAVVVVLSDGWDRGDPAVLAEQMARLGRVAHSVIWVNPLRASPGYEPLARGMAAALPFVDHFVDGHSLDSLHTLAAVIAGETGRLPGQRAR